MSINALKKLTATDIMERDVVTIGQEQSLRDALDLMTDSHLTGLPVMDTQSKCTGMITASDILNYEEDHAGQADEVNEAVAQHFNADTYQWESVRTTSFGLEEFGDVGVKEVMTRDLVFVERATPVLEIAQKMLEGKIHRVLVLDETYHLYGIVSAVDFVRVIAEL